tara:strand:- start:281 stop:700 length:420 start_codon:yes stop_codon:yes gene_type:complete
MKKKMFAYLISHEKRDLKTHTYIGCTEHFKKRLMQHNNELPGGPRITKRAAGSWKPVVVLELPAKRSFSSKSLKKKWKQSSRGLDSRIRKAFELALTYKLKIYISEHNTTGIFKQLHSKWDNHTIKLTLKEYTTIIKSF